MGPINASTPQKMAIQIARDSHFGIHYYTLQLNVSYIKDSKDQRQKQDKIQNKDLTKTYEFSVFAKKYHKKQINKR